MGHRTIIDGQAGSVSTPQASAAPPRLCEPEEITRALTAILQSGPFRGSPLLRALLGFLVRRSLAGEEASLDATAIARQALGKGPGFCSSKDASVRVAMNRLRTALHVYYAAEGANQDIVIVLEPGNNCPLFKRRPQANKPDGVADALQLAVSYQRILSPAANRCALHAIRRPLRSQPDHPSLLAAYIDLCLDSYKFNFGTLAHPLAEARRAIECAARRVPPNDPTMLFPRAFFALARDDLDGAGEIAQAMLQAAPEDIESRLLGEFVMAHTMPPAQALENASTRPEEHADAVPWLHLTPFLAAYQERNYETALGSAINIGLPDFFWGPTLRAAVLAKLGLKDVARNQLERAVLQNADLAEAPRWYLQHHIKHKETLEHLLEGLYEAGLGR